jgi:hypothetical protein
MLAEILQNGLRCTLRRHPPRGIAATLLTDVAGHMVAIDHETSAHWMHARVRPFEADAARQANLQVA